MKKAILPLILAATAAGFFLTNCNSTSEKMDEAKANLEIATQKQQQAKTDYRDQYNTFVIESDQKTAANEKSIIELKANAQHLKKEAKANYEKAISELEQRNEDLKEKVKGYNEEGLEKWASFKEEFNHDMDELGQAFKDFTKNNIK